MSIVFREPTSLEESGVSQRNWLLVHLQEHAGLFGDLTSPFVQPGRHILHLGKGTIFRFVKFLVWHGLEMGFFLIYQISNLPIYTDSFLISYQILSSNKNLDIAHLYTAPKLDAKTQPNP